MKRVLLATLSAAAMIGVSEANIISFSETVTDTDFVSAGVGGLRGNGAGTIGLSGTSGTINKAYLYWHGPTDSTDPNFNANVTVNGQQVTGTNIGFSDDNFWGQLNSQAYRADVTSLVSGDGSYDISGLPANNINGASLVVFFDDGDDTNNRDVVLFEGNDANFANPFDPVGWDITLAGIDYEGGTANLQLHVSDGQNFSAFDDGDLVVNGNILASGGIFQGDSVPVTPGSSVTNGGLWDIEDFDITGELSLGLNTLNVTLGDVNDALSVIVAAIDLPVGAAPEIPVPAAAFLFGPIAAAAAWRRRRVAG